MPATRAVVEDGTLEESLADRLWRATALRISETDCDAMCAGWTALEGKLQVYIGQATDRFWSVERARGFPAIRLLDGAGGPARRQPQFRSKKRQRDGTVPRPVRQHNVVRARRLGLLHE